MDDTNFFEIDSDELRELKEIAKTIESPPQTTQQQQKVVYQKQSTPPPEPLPLPQSPKHENKVQPKKTKELITYTCICGGVYYLEHWFIKHQQKCAIVKIHQ